MGQSSHSLSLKTVPPTSQHTAHILAAASPRPHPAPPPCSSQAAGSSIGRHMSSLPYQAVHFAQVLVCAGVGMARGILRGQRATVYAASHQKEDAWRKAWKLPLLNAVMDRSTERATC